MNVKEYWQKIWEAEREARAYENYLEGKQWSETDIASMKVRQKEINDKMATISMTKAEAMQKLKDAGVPRDISGDYHIIKILEALGLLRIEPEVRLIKAKDVHGNDIELTDAIIKDIALMYNIKI